MLRCGFESFAEFKPYLEGFVVTMHEGACDQEVPIPRPMSSGMDLCLHMLSALWQQEQLGFNHNYNITYLISPHEW